MQVAAIIVTYNGAQWLQHCLDALFNSTVVPVVYCIDNNSTDDSKKIMEAFGDRIKTVYSNKNLGFGAANNTGIRRAMEDGADFFLLINQDVYVSHDSIATLVTLLQEKADAGIASPLHMNGTNTAFDKNFLHHLTATDKSFVNDLYFNRNNNHNYEVKFINAACWMLPRTTVEKVGGFDPLFFHYGEDDNYCNRVLYHGLKIIVTTATSICHDRDERDGNLRPEFTKQQSYRTWLLKVSNVFNKDNAGLQKQLRHTMLRDVFRNIAVLRVSNAWHSYKTYAGRKEIFKKAVEHKGINSTTGMHWLKNLPAF